MYVEDQTFLSELKKKRSTLQIFLCKYFAMPLLCSAVNFFCLGTFFLNDDNGRIGMCTWNLLRSSQLAYLKPISSPGKDTFYHIEIISRDKTQGEKGQDSFLTHF